MSYTLIVSRNMFAVNRLRQGNTRSVGQGTTKLDAQRDYSYRHSFFNPVNRICGYFALKLQGVLVIQAANQRVVQSQQKSWPATTAVSELALGDARRLGIDGAVKGAEFGGAGKTR